MARDQQDLEGFPAIQREQKRRTQRHAFNILRFLRASQVDRMMKITFWSDGEVVMPLSIHACRRGARIPHNLNIRS